MPQRTDFFDIGRLGLTSGEGRRLDLHVHVDPFDYGGSSYAVEPELVPVRLDISRTTGERLGAAAALRRGRSKARACAAWSNATPHLRGGLLRGPPARRGRRGPALALHARTRARPRGVGARRARARPADPDHVPPGLRRPVRAVRREPQRGSRPRARGASRTRAGRSCPSSSSTRRVAILSRRHGRP